MDGWPVFVLCIILSLVKELLIETIRLFRKIRDTNGSDPNWQFKVPKRSESKKNLFNYNGSYEFFIHIEHKESFNQSFKALVCILIGSM